MTLYNNIMAWLTWGWGDRSVTVPPVSLDEFLVGNPFFLCKRVFSHLLFGLLGGFLRMVIDVKREIWGLDLTGVWNEIFRNV